MEVKILGWSCKGIRGVNDVEVDLTKNEQVPYSISLILMPNGTGKTTITQLIRATFDGQANNWDAQYIRAFKPANTFLKKGQFLARVFINNSIYIIILNLNYEKGIAFYQTTRTESGGLEDGHLLPSEVKHAFTEEFVKRFIFDGELAKDILKADKNEAEEAIKHLYKINMLGELRAKIDQMVEEEQKKNENTKSSTMMGLKRLRNQKESLEKQLNSLKDRNKARSEEMAIKQSRLNDVKSEINNRVRQDKNLGEQQKTLEKELLIEEEKTKLFTQSTLEEMRDPYKLSPEIASSLTSLFNKLEKLKLPKTTSRQFFEELANQKTCVCGRNIGSVEKKCITENAGRYLGEDQIGVINAVKTAIAKKELEGSIKGEINKLKDSYLKRADINRQLISLRQKRVASGDDELEALEQEEKDLIKEIETLEEELDCLNTKDKVKLKKLSEDDNIFLCENQLNAIYLKLAEATNTMETSQKASKAKHYLKMIEKKSLEKIKERIVNETNDKLSQIIRNEIIEVESIGNYLKLRGKEGASEGQTLSIAYSYLGSLFESSAYSLPFIVDSPAGSLDLDVRRQVSKIIPRLFHQLIIFITSGERLAFADYFYSKDSKVLFLTINKEAGSKTSCIKGVSMFKSFQGES